MKSQPTRRARYREILGKQLAEQLDNTPGQGFRAFMEALPEEKRLALTAVDAGAALHLSSQFIARVLEILPQIAIFDPDHEHTARMVKEGLADIARLDGLIATGTLSRLGICPAEAQAIGQDLVEAAHEALGLPGGAD